MTAASQAKACLKVFSGIQPTGIPHLGNYFGAIAQWIRLTKERQTKVDGDNKLSECDIPVFAIVDVHAYTSPSTSFGPKLYDNILSTTASLLALGLDHEKCILYRQSDLLEHNYLDNVFDIFVTPTRLARMNQFREKSATTKEISNGLLNYPILQAADILLHRANLVPVGEDQSQHIELTRHIARRFNSMTQSALFPEPKALLVESEHAHRIKSLRDPEKKMSKSDANKKSFIEVVDEPEMIVEKCKKALTDSISDVYYDLDNRPGVSNLVQIYHLTTGDSIEQIIEQQKGIETAQFKLRLADVLIDKFRTTRDEFKRLRNDPGYLESVLKLGKSKAEPMAMDTIVKVKHLLGSLGLPEQISD